MSYEPQTSAAIRFLGEHVQTISYALLAFVQFSMTFLAHRYIFPADNIRDRWLSSDLLCALCLMYIS